MSIRLRLTLLYTAILTLTLLVFGFGLYTLQAQETMNALRRDLSLRGDSLSQNVLDRLLHPNTAPPPEPPQAPPPTPNSTLGNANAFPNLREREIARILDAQGRIAASPIGRANEALPLSAEGLATLQQQQLWWEIALVDEEPMLIYNRPVVLDGQLVFIVQTARSLAERHNSLTTLSRTLLIAGLLCILLAFAIGWTLAGFALRPIQHITQTAREIGSEHDLTRRVAYQGSDDEIGQLATTFNLMLTRLQEAYQRVNHALTMQRDFVADVSHELRTPLTTVRGNLELLRGTPPPPPDEAADILNDLVEESERLIRLVNELLLLARADTERRRLLEPTPLRPLLEELARQAHQLDPEREILITAPPVTALADRDALKQLLLILLDNALKYSQGRITLTAQDEGDQGKQLLLEVADEGPGMAPEELQHVFDRFYRGTAAVTTVGFGLGLSIAHTLAAAQHGELTLTSPPNSGLHARLRLKKSTEP